MNSSSALRTCSRSSSRRQSLRRGSAAELLADPQDAPTPRDPRPKGWGRTEGPGPKLSIAPIRRSKGEIHFLKDYREDYDENLFGIYENGDLKTFDTEKEAQTCSTNTTLRGRFEHEVSGSGIEMK